MIPAVGSKWVKSSDCTDRIVDRFVVLEVFAIREDGTHPRHDIQHPTKGELIAYGVCNGAAGQYITVKNLFGSWGFLPR